MLAMEVGTGKTAVALTLAREWKAERILVTCPLSVVGVWPREVEDVDMTRFDPANYYSESQIEEYVKQLRQERVEHLRAYDRLDNTVIEAHS